MVDRQGNNSQIEFDTNITVVIMSRYLKTLLALVTATVLAACGGGGDTGTFTVTRSLESTTYSCPTQATFDVCRASDCGQCTCTIGCDANAPKVKLAVSMSPTTLAVDQESTLTLRLSSNATVKQTARFTLNYADGGAQYSALAFTAPCITTSLSVGGQSIVASVLVPANTASCTFTIKKRFTSPASPATISLSSLEKVELDGALPNVTVTP